MVKEVLENLIIDNKGKYVDCTFGMGGHTKKILDKLSSVGSLYAIDKDPYSAELAKDLALTESRLSVINDNFSNIKNYFGTNEVDGVLLDLGISSYQLDTGNRGFSFQQDGPLDMRINQNEGISAKDWINTAKQKEIEDVLWLIGEERFSRKIARAICSKRLKYSIETTGELAEVILSVVPRRSKKHPATNSFRAIRMFINKEIEELREGLEEVANVLHPGARMAIISFHSIEDRIAKRFIQGKDRMRSQIKFNLVGGKPMKPSFEEIKNNPRSRSAILRIAEKVA